MDLAKIANKRRTHDAVVNIVSKMLRVDRREIVDHQTLKERMRLFYYECNGKIRGRGLDLILGTYEILRGDPESIHRLLGDAFYDNDILKNYASTTLIDKIQFTSTRQLVRVEFHVVHDYKLCRPCYGRLGRSAAEPDVISECAVDPEHSFWFLCNYICDYCFVNKLYKKL